MCPGNIANHWPALLYRVSTCDLEEGEEEEEECEIFTVNTEQEASQQSQNEEELFA